jgi:hypothetical protein
MKIEKKFDQILDILYDDSKLLFKEVVTTDLLVFGEKKHNIKWTDSDKIYIINVLIDEGYVIMNSGDFTGNNVKMPTYSLTTKGIRLKQNGGFVRKKRIEFLTQFLIFSASIVTIIVGFTTCFDFYKKYLNPTEVSTENTKQTSTKCYDYCPDSCGIKHKKSVVDSSTIRQNIKKPNIVPTKK